MRKRDRTVNGPIEDVFQAPCEKGNKVLRIDERQEWERRSFQARPPSWHRENNSGGAVLRKWQRGNTAGGDPAPGEEIARAFEAHP